MRSVNDEEGRRKKEEGRRKKEEGRRKKVLTFDFQCPMPDARCFYARCFYARCPMPDARCPISI
ncbi:MAG: hypothetical protein JGK24_22995 [Microcoleus sp. PH2017_29_MFU_D_A]|uniref:hypothetical protein n=1 Tax=unclassified Microcoleus TaxID=2642155 RepID=UPI001D3E9366|nr:MULTISPECIES: hypothetical protein [unclassified Microcoleus]MCC3586787.1 hypothetical protein [Microcoleus sp. PH2017_30_WIL_O_A]MCC3589722.1 hypothetical protein [Microcoleus sp. PH2017_28_MFU_U_A]MCC3606015.1 hypothetical protein [Microcoleus sp. PH2017_29_MFU_D_A]MCC3637092.1 hypothetical protein [Microcoleus sp. PH2017_37_MFU_D_B]